MMDIIKKTGNQPQKQPTEFSKMTKDDVMKHFTNLIKNLETITLNGAWAKHKEMYIKNILPFANVESVKVVDGQNYKIYKFKYDKEIYEHPFFKHFLISLVSVNRHEIKDNVEKLKIETKIDEIKKNFNGFTTLECIFNNEKALETSYNEYVKADQNLIAQLSKTFEAGAKDVMVKIIKAFCLMQVLSYIELCDVKSHNIRIKTIEKIIKEQVNGKDGKPYIPADILKAILDKIQKVNDHNNLNFGVLDDFEKQKKDVIYRNEKDIVYDEKISKILDEVPKKDEPKKDEPKKDEPKPLPVNPEIQKYQIKINDIIKTIPKFSVMNNTVVDKLKDFIAKDDNQTTETTKKIYENRDIRLATLLTKPVTSETTKEYLKLLEETYNNINARHTKSVGNPVYNYAMELKKIHDSLQEMQKNVDDKNDAKLKQDFEKQVETINKSIEYVKNPVTVIKGGSDDVYKRKYLKYKAKYLQTKL